MVSLDKPPGSTQRRTGKDNDVDFLFPPHERKSNCYTRNHRYPRTTHLSDFMDWSSNPVAGGRNMYSTPQRPVYPLLPQERFMPLDPDISAEKAIQMRLGMTNPRGLKTPLEAIHIAQGVKTGFVGTGYRKFSLDPSAKRLRRHNDVIPQPLITTKRVSYQDPNERRDLLVPMTTTRNGFCPDQGITVGIVPETFAVPLEPVVDTSQCRDYVYVPKFARKKVRPT